MEFDFEREHKPLGKRIWFRIVVWILQLGAAVGLAWVLIHVSVERTVMTGSSMEPTLADGTSIVINKIAYWIGDPGRYDVIVFRQSGSEHSYYNIKRVIGLPGETVRIADGIVYINGEALQEPMNVEAVRIGGLAEEDLTLDENEYFVLGDNRNNSEDSRFANIGCIVRDDIIGKAWLTLSPFNFVDKLNPADVDE